MGLRYQTGVIHSSSWLLVASVLLASGAAYLVSSALPYRLAQRRAAAATGVSPASE